MWLMSSQPSTKNFVLYLDPNLCPMLVTTTTQQKGGVDAADERVSTYATKYKKNSWYVAFFCNILDLSALNIFVVHSHVNPSCNQNKLYRRRLLLLELGQSLWKDHINHHVIHYSTVLCFSIGNS